LQFPLNAQLLQSAKEVILLHGEDAENERVKTFTKQGVQCYAFPVTERGLDLEKVTQFLGLQGLHDVWLEAGGKLFSQCVHQRLCQRILLYLGAMTMGPEGLDAFGKKDLFQNTKVIKWQQFGDDVMCELSIEQ